MPTTSTNERAPMKLMHALVLSVTLALGLSPASAEQSPTAVAEAFTQALQTGDVATVKDLLSADVLIFETGGQERSREEYFAHHLKSDMAFLAKARVEVLDRKQTESGDVTWIATRSRITGTYQDQPLDLYSTESLVLRRDAGVWRIAHIHWSSRSAAPKKP